MRHLVTVLIAWGFSCCACLASSTDLSFAHATTPSDYGDVEIIDDAALSGLVDDAGRLVLSDETYQPLPSLLQSPLALTKR